ncbi:MAG: beta-ketoacyl synthase N-terminal-like domain-containing protein, partial [Verrucomicrobiota bacterium]
MRMPARVRVLAEAPVVITGMGGVCAAGLDAAAIWEAAMQGRASGGWESVEFGGKLHRLAVGRAPLALSGDPRLAAVRRSDRSVQLAWWAAREALGQAGIPSGSALAARMGILAGSSRGPAGKAAEGVALLG